MGSTPRTDDATHLDPAMAPGTSKDDTLTWIDPRQAPVELTGFAWFNSDETYRRMPLAPPETLPEAVDQLANNTAGGTIRLRTDSPCLHLRVELSGPANMVHMAATGEAGFDLYIGEPGQERFAGVTKFERHLDAYEVSLWSGPQRWRDITLNFPLYKGVRSIEIGIRNDADLASPTPRSDAPPLLFYGSSITQGGCATRPGMAYPAILSRRLQRVCLNLGFSGAGKGEPEVARALATIDACGLFVLDYDPNCPSAEHLRRTLPVFVEILRQRHPLTPILVVSRTPGVAEVHEATALEGRRERLRAQAEAVEAIQTAGDPAIRFFDGSDLMGENHHECTVDGSHPTDLGFLRMADHLEPVLRQMLGACRKTPEGRRQPK